MSISYLSVANVLVVWSAKMFCIGATSVSWTQITLLTTPAEMLYLIMLGYATIIHVHNFTA